MNWGEEGGDDEWTTGNFVGGPKILPAEDRQRLRLSGRSDWLGRVYGPGGPGGSTV